MADPEHPQIYLITPPQFDLSTSSNDLAAVLDKFEIACVRMRCTSEVAHTISLAADTLRKVCHERNVPLVVENHGKIAAAHGLDGVHLNDGARQIHAMRKLLGDSAIIGSFCENSRHYGLTAAESGADYVSFGPITETSFFPSEPVDFATFEWWFQVIEVPVVAEGAITLEHAERLAPVIDFLALGTEIWENSDGPVKALSAYLDRIR